MDSNKMIGERIGKLLAEKDITQQQLADCIGVKRETIVQWLNGTRKIKAEHIIMLCSALNVSADHLLFGDDVKSRDPDVKICCQYTGLSEDAIETLHMTKANIADTLSLIITSPKILELHSAFKNAESALHYLIENAKHHKGDLLINYKQYKYSRYDISETMLNIFNDIYRGDTDIASGMGMLIE